MIVYVRHYERGLLHHITALARSCGRVVRLDAS